MEHEVLNRNQAADFAAWWRRAFQVPSTSKKPKSPQWNRRAGCRAEASRRVLANERSKDLRFGWHEDVDQVNSISMELAGIAIDAYVGTLGESGAEPPQAVLHVPPVE